MRDAGIEQAIAQATADVLEKMFFTGFAAETEEIGEAGPQIRIRVPFTAQRRGVLWLRIADRAARTLAGDFLGLEAGEGATGEQVREVARELANMICGDALSHVESGALILGAPEVMPADAWVAQPGASRRSFDLGEGALTVAIALEGGADG